MSISIRRLLWPICLCLVTASATAALPQADVEDLMHRSGLWEQLASLGAQVRAGMGQDGPPGAGPRPSPEEMARLDKAAEAAFSPSRLRATAARVLADGLDERHLAALRAWYASPAGVRMTQLEEQASRQQLDRRAAMTEGMAVRERATPQRRELLDALLRETRAVDAAVEMTLEVALAVQRGVASAMPGAPAMDADEIRAALARQRPALREAYTAMSTASMALTYESAGDDELARYVAFTHSEAGSHFTAIGLQALAAVMSEATEELGRRLPGTRDRANT